MSHDSREDSRRDSAGGLEDGLNEDQLDEAVTGYIDRLNDGEMLDPHKILGEHPRSGPAIWKRLELFHELAGRKESASPLGTLRRRADRRGRDA
jgi:hypothetical protein